MAAAVQTRSPRARRLLLGLNRAILAFARRWLAITNLLSLALAGLPLLAAWLAAHGQAALAWPIYAGYAAICTQIPSHSFYPWGAQMATCQRETAIYASMVLAGLAFARLRARLRPLGWRPFAALIAPLAIDGVTQWLGWRESTPALRLLTGSLFGLACVWLLYPRLEAGMAEIVAIVEARFRRLGLA
jgi:uncharacterized membrane protein